jgi:hypothetical protein
MFDLAELRLTPEAMASFGLPDIGYPVPLEALLFGLQQRSSDSGRDFRRYEPAMTRLAALLAPADDHRESVTVTGNGWSLEVGAVDLEGEVVTLQRDYEIVAAVSPRADGRLRIAVFRPLDASSAARQRALAQHPDPEGRVCGHASNWRYAREIAAAPGQRHAAESDRAYPSYWPQGIGTLHDQTASPVYVVDRLPTPRRPAEVAVDLGLRAPGIDVP